MQYIIGDMIKQMTDTLKADAVFSGMTVRRHAGEVNIMLFRDPAYWRDMLAIAPFVLVKYQGRMATQQDSVGKIWMHELTFSAYVATKSMALKSGVESSEAAEIMLARIFDLWHGKMFLSNRTWASNIPILSGTQITTSDFNQQRALMESGGQDERLIMTLPEITLYETKYNVRMIVS